VSLDGVGALFRVLGFGGPLLELSKRTRDTLTLPETVRAAHIAKGPDSLRGLALELQGNAGLRQSLTDVAISLARQSPELLWLVICTHALERELAIVCWSSAGGRTRIVSLQVHRDRVFGSDAETLCALSSAVSSSDLLTHSRWLDILGREAITRRFFRGLRASVAELAESIGSRVAADERRELALLYVSRLLFLSFLETKGWLDGDFGFLSNGYSRCIEAGGKYQQRILEPLFFGTLNTPVRRRSARARNFGRIPFLNGGLFARSHLEKRRRDCVFSDESFGTTYGSLLSRYRFTPREDSEAWSEASIDPEMLGKAFEALMAADERKSSGAFYTPQPLVREVIDQALQSALAGRKSAGRDCSSDRMDLLRSIRVLDPACGSGAFLVHMLERIAFLRVEAGESASVAEIKRRVLTTSIFGVDLNPTAVWLCELRLWLAIVIESADADPMRVVPLPNLDRHIRVGDSLGGGGFADMVLTPRGKSVAVLRNRYMRASGPRKRTLVRAMDRAERGAAIAVLERRRVRITSERRELLIALRARDLFGERHRPDRETALRLRTVRAEIGKVATRVRQLRDGAALPFSFAAHFSDVGTAGGFDLVVGNPPWVRLHEIAESSREKLRRDFTVYRNAAWQSGATAAGAGRGFAAQIDMSALFVERSIELLKPVGTLALLLPSKLWRSLAGGGVRQLLRDRTDLIALEDLVESPSQFDAAVYPSLLVSRKKSAARQPAPDFDARVHLGKRVLTWRSASECLTFDASPGSPWVILPPPARGAFDLLRDHGVPYASTEFGRPLLGVKTGCNSAFIVRLESVDGAIASISTRDRNGLIERDMLRPLIRGETLSQWCTTKRGEYLVWPQLESGLPRRELPGLTRKWLAPFRDQLVARSDLHGRFPWWTVFRTESAHHAAPRVIWADFGLTPRAVVVEAGDPLVPLNSCYVTCCKTLEDAHALAALLNSPLAAAWLNVLAEPARGGYRRYLGWTVSLLPVPKDWDHARTKLAPLGARALSGDIPSDAELLAASVEAYRLTLSDEEPLLSWNRDSD
jgi:hypothetical protein